MGNFSESIPHVLKWEGGFVDHPADPGGATNRGIILSLFKQYASELGLEPNVDALKLLTEEQAKRIYKKHFWDKMRGDDFRNQRVADITFDAFVNCGYNGTKITQRCAGTKPDGIIGPNSLEAINISMPETLFNKIKLARIEYYENLATRKPQMKVFLKGWLNRINSFKYES
jgi:lysozyme family protein